MSTVISIEDVSKLYRLGEIGTGSLAHDINRWWHKVRGNEDPYLKVGQSNDRSTKGDSDYVYAVKDVSFDVKQGEALGIIGRNGAGKSTLLKILSRVTTPTSGKIKVKGRIASLLEVGTGFHPELTGRENIYLNGAILGMRKDEIRSKFAEIVDFSGCERYINTPVKRYSSGMYVRLAFAVAAHLEPEILIVDEVLAVGDADFQKKCLGKMKDVAGEGRTVLFVSHNIQAISNLCSTAVSMENGRIACIGSVSKCVEDYLKSASQTSGTWSRSLSASKTESLIFSKIDLQIFGDQPEITLVLKCKTFSLKKHKPAFVAIDILDNTGVTIMQAIPTLKPLITSESSEITFQINVQLPPLVPGTYFVSLWLGPHNDETYNEINNCVCFQINETPTAGRNFPHSRNHGCIVPLSSIHLLH